MRKFIFHVIIFTGLQLALFSILVSAYYRPDRSHYLAGTLDKHRILEETPSPRLIFLGGSNLPFSLDSGLIKKSFPKYNPVDMGLHAALRLEYMLREVRDDLRAGDVVVVSIEYEQLTKAIGGGARADLLLRVFEQRPANLKYLSLMQLRGILDQGLTTYAGGVVRSAFSVMVGRSAKKKIVDSRSGFNKFGDMVAHYGDDSEDVSKIPINASSYSDEHVCKAIKLLNDFYELCKERNVRAFFAYPAFPEYHFRKVQEPMLKLIGKVERKLNIPIINKADEMLFPLDNFYNTVYHLNRAGVLRRTSMLIEDLRPYL